MYDRFCNLINRQTYFLRGEDITYPVDECDDDYDDYITLVHEGNFLNIVSETSYL